MVIRRAVESDLDPLVRILDPDPGRPRLVNRFLEQKAGIRLLFVLEIDGVVVGTVSVSPHVDVDGETPRLFALDVGKAFRRRGFATLMVGEIERLVAIEGHPVVRLEVAVDNTGAIQLYENLGYEKVGLPQKLIWSKGVDGHPTDDVVEVSHLMHKRLG